MNHCHLQLIVKISSPFKLLIGSGKYTVHERHCGSISKSHILGVLYYTCEDIEQRKWWGELCFNSALQKLNG